MLCYAHVYNMRTSCNVYRFFFFWNLKMANKKLRRNTYFVVVHAQILFSRWTMNFSDGLHAIWIMAVSCVMGRTSDQVGIRETDSFCQNWFESIQARELFWIVIRNLSQNICHFCIHHHVFQTITVNSNLAHLIKLWISSKLIENSGKTLLLQTLRYEFACWQLFFSFFFAKTTSWHAPMNPIHI